MKTMAIPTVCVACSLLAGCVSSTPVETRPEWKALTGDDSTAALAALCKLDERVRKGMSESEVLALFPPNVLVKKAKKEQYVSFSLFLRADLSTKILRPHAIGLYGYGISFGHDRRVLCHSVVLMGDF